MNYARAESRRRTTQAAYDRQEPQYETDAEQDDDDVQEARIGVADLLKRLVRNEEEVTNGELSAAADAVADLARHADTLATVVSNLIAARQINAAYGQYVTDVTAALAKVAP